MKVVALLLKIYCALITKPFEVIVTFEDMYLNSQSIALLTLSTILNNIDLHPHDT